MSGRDFVLLVVDRDTAEFSVEGPMTDDGPWHRAIQCAQYAGRNIWMLPMGSLTPDAAAAEWLAASGGRRVATGSIIAPEYILL